MHSNTRQRIALGASQPVISLQVAARLALVAITVLLTAPVWADVMVGLFARDETLATPVTFEGTSAILLSQEVNGGSSYAFGSSDLNAGVLQAIATTVPNGLSFGRVAASTVVVSDTFTFTSGFGSLAFLDWSFDGFISTNPDKAVTSTGSVGSFVIDVRRDGSDLAFVSNVLTNASGCGGAVTLCVIGSLIAITDSLPIPIAPGSYSLETTLAAFAILGDDANFGGTSRLFFRLPDGVAITSGSGQLLAGAAPIVSRIPEPTTYALLLIGLVGVGVTGAGRRKG